MRRPAGVASSFSERERWATPDEAPVGVRIVLMIPGVVGMAVLVWWLIPWRAVL